TLMSVLTSMERVDVPLGEIRIVLNNLGANSDVRTKDVDEFLPFGLTATLPWSKKLGVSSSVGRTVFEVEPHGDLAIRMNALFAAFVDDRPGAPAPQKRRVIRTPFRRRP